MTVLLFRKRPIIVEARQVNAEDWEMCEDIARWSGAELVDIDHYRMSDDPGVMWIHTLEGMLLAEDGDWIVRGIAGEFYPVKPDIFEGTYERVINL